MSQIVIFATFKAKDGSVEFVREQLALLSSRCRSEPGCLLYQPYCDIKQPDTFYLHEIWENKALLKIHGEAAPLREFRGSVSEHLETKETRFARSF